MRKVGTEQIEWQGRHWLKGYVKLGYINAADLALTPTDGYVHLYSKDTDSPTKLYYKDDAGVEHELAVSTAIITDHGALTGLTDDDHTIYLKEKASGGSAAEVPEHTHADAANAGTIDHGALTGLSDDDHPQYRLESEDHTHQSTGMQGGQLDHGLALTGLSDDDHPQYVLRGILTTNGDIFIRSAGAVGRLGIGTDGQVLTVVSGAPAWDDATTGVTDHGALTGLGDDDHTIYALLAGRSGGQTLNGGTDSGDELVIHSSSHATKGDIDLHCADLTFLAAARARMASQNRFRFLNSMASVKMAGDQTLTTATVTTVNFGAEDVDTDALHDNSTNNSRITIALTGKYLIGGVLNYAANGTGVRQIRLHQDGNATPIRISAVPGMAGDNARPSAVWLVSATAGTYFELKAYQDSGGDLTLSSSAPNSHFFVVYMGE